MITKFKILCWDRNYGYQVFHSQIQLSGNIQTFPPSYRNILEISYRLRGVELKKRNVPKQKIGLDDVLDDVFENPFPRRECPDSMYKQIKGYRMHNSELRVHPNCALDRPCFYTWGTKYMFVTIVVCSSI